jgi:iron complex transport system ATP-binding protein
MLTCKNILYSIKEKKILDSLSIHFKPGLFNMILGPNGSGKSTFLKIFSGLVKPTSGQILYKDNNVFLIPTTQLATYRAVMSQLPELSFPLTAFEVIMMGRYPHFKIKPTTLDINICNEVIEKLNITDFKNRNYLTLSGGEKQRVQFARTLVQVWQKPKKNKYRYLFLDEPLSSLDIKYQHEFLSIAKQFCDEQTILIAIMHDINLAMQYGDDLFFLKSGQLMANTNSTNPISTNLINKVFDIDSTIFTHPNTIQQYVVCKP